MKRTKVFLWLLFAHIACIIKAEVPPYTQVDVWEAYESFNRYLLDQTKYIYKTDTSFPQATDRWNGAAAIWCQPIYWDMAMNAYKLARKQKDGHRAKQYEKLSRAIFEGNKAQYAGFNFDDNNENTGWFIYDDIQWWTITLARAYALFGNEEYLTFAKKSFHRVWYGSPKVRDTGPYDAKNGGMFWQWQPIRNPKPNDSEKDGKMACINFPTVVAAAMLYRLVPDDEKEQYLNKAKEIYRWGTDNLFDAASGQIADSRHGNHKPDWKAHVYNQATFIGGSALLYQITGEQAYLDNAIQAADYVTETMSAPHGLLPFESGIEQGIYTAILAQYMAMLVYECGQRQYLPFLQRNIGYGWANRDKTRNLCGGKYEEALPEGSCIDSYSASGIPALMLLFPPDEKK